MKYKICVKLIEIKQQDYLFPFFSLRKTKSIFCVDNFDTYIPLLLADLGEARGCSTKTFVINWLICWLSDPLVKISLRRRHTQTVKNGASSHKTNYIDIFSEILNPEGLKNRCIGSKVTGILLNR